MSTPLARELNRSKYRLLGLVGQGQFGRVYCAVHRKTGRLFALKELNKDRFPTHKFLRELRFLLSLQHPHIVTCYALEHTPTGRYLVMDYCEGGTLRGLMEEDVRLHPSQCLRLIADVLSGLDHAHSRGIVHCDIKPENILLVLQSDGWTARISDFGIARLSQELSKDGTGNTGSPAYMAPERFYGQHFHSSDLYSVGILLYELLTGYRPFSGAPAELMSAHLNQPVKFPDFIPPNLQTIILMALQKLPARRFRSAAEMLRAVEAAPTSFPPEFVATWADHPLLESIASPPLCSYESVYEEALESRRQQLVGADDVPSISRSGRTESAVNQIAKLYQVFGSYVRCQPYQTDLDGFAPAENFLPPVRLPELVQEILLRPQGCFAVTTKAVYLIPDTLFQSGVAQHGQRYLQQACQGAAIRHTVPQLVAEFSRDFLTTIEAEGRWMVTAPLESDRVNSRLHIWRLPQLQSDKSVLRNTVSLGINRSPSHLFRLLALDSHHFAAFSHEIDRSANACIVGMVMEIFTRRGNFISAINFPIPLRQVTPSSRPYHLIAAEPGQPKSILLIDLKPLRLRRVAVEIVPSFLAMASWGYVLADPEGQIVLLNPYGEKLGRIQGPANPTAITMLNPYHLLVATWNQHQGDLVAIDLRQMDLDILF